MNKVKKIVIDNFRNITHAEYSMSDTNIFTGANKQGKTNTILAVYWALVHSLFDGSSNFSSFKPIGNEKEVVSVELVFEEFTFKKSFYEKWVKTKGTDIMTMTTHETKYEIDGIEYKKNAEAIDKLNELLGIDKLDIPKNINVVRMLLDPLYLGNQLEWKSLRELIVSLVGDVSDFDVLNSDSKFKAIQERLTQDKFNTELSSKFYKQKIKESKDSIKDKETQIKGLETVKDVSPEALKTAEEEIERINGLIQSIKTGDNTQAINDIKSKLISKREELSTEKEKDKAVIQSFNERIQTEIKQIESEVESINKVLDLKRAEKIAIEGQISSNYTETNKINMEISNVQQQKNYKLNEYKALELSEFKPLEIPEGLLCSKCGHDLNEDVKRDVEIKNSTALVSFESNKKAKMGEIIQQGKELASQIENLNFKLEELKKIDNELSSKLSLIRNEISEIEMSKAPFDERIRTKRREVINHVVNDKIPSIEASIANIEQELKNIQLQGQSTVNEAEKAYKDELAIHTNVKDEHTAFIKTQKQIELLNEEISVIQAKQIEFESMLIIIESFVQTKLNLFKQNIVNVFGDRVQWTLIEQNIKEESWSEVCYPSVLDKTTPFNQGSGAERIQTGIYIIEKIKEKLGVSGLPIIFDECEKLDSESIQTLNTNSQIITSKVDDSKFKEVTLISY